MTALVCFAILLFGIVAFRALPVAALPSVDYPTIQVTAAVPGANPETMASSVATPLEREFSTIAGIQSMNSHELAGQHRPSPCSSRWTARSTPPRRTFRPPSRAPAAACPPACRGRLPIRRSTRPSSRCSTWRWIPTRCRSTPSTNTPTRCWRSASPWSAACARVQVYGAQKYAVRVQVDPDQLAAHDIGIDEVQRAIACSNTNLPTGQLDGATPGVHHRIERARSPTPPPTGRSSWPSATAFAGAAGTARPT